jgi:predicted nucleic acid-binding protein
VQIIGAIRQEVLSGIRELLYYERLRAYLRGFDDEPLTREDFEQAAAANNTSRAMGISGSPADFLICATAIRHGWEIFTADSDFTDYARALGIVLYKPRELAG